MAMRILQKNILMVLPLGVLDLFDKIEGIHDFNANMGFSIYECWMDAFVIDKLCE